MNQLKLPFNRLMLLNISLLASVSFNIAFSQTQQAFMVKALVSGKLEDSLNSFGLGMAKILYTHDFDTKDNGEIDWGYFTERIHTIIPDKHYNGAAILDWEGKSYEVFRTEKAGSPLFTKYIQKYIQLLSFAKTLRPKAKWGFYGFPLTTYWWKTDTLWQQRNTALQPIYTASDALYPYLYDFYKDGSYGWLDEPGYIIQNTKESIKRSIKSKKPVYIFVWHRYHDATENVGLQVIDPSEFELHLTTLLNTTFQEKYVNGLVWWQEDMYYAENDKRLVAEKGNKSSRQYVDEVLLKYGAIISKVMKGTYKK